MSEENLGMVDRQQRYSSVQRVCSEISTSWMKPLVGVPSEVQLRPQRTCRYGSIEAERDYPGKSRRISDLSTFDGGCGDRCSLRVVA